MRTKSRICHFAAVGCFAMAANTIISCGAAPDVATESNDKASETAENAVTSESEATAEATAQSYPQPPEWCPNTFISGLSSKVCGSWADIYSGVCVSCYGSGACGDIDDPPPHYAYKQLQSRWCDYWTGGFYEYRYRLAGCGCPPLGV